MHCAMCKCANFSAEPAAVSQAKLSRHHHANAQQSSPCPRLSCAGGLQSGPASSFGLCVQVRPYQMAIASSDPYVRVYDRRMLATGTCFAHCLGLHLRLSNTDLIVTFHNKEEDESSSWISSQDQLAHDQQNLPMTASEACLRLPDGGCDGPLFAGTPDSAAVLAEPVLRMAPPHMCLGKACCHCSHSRFE